MGRNSSQNNNNLKHLYTDISSSEYQGGGKAEISAEKSVREWGEILPKITKSLKISTQISKTNHAPFW